MAAEPAGSQSSSESSSQSSFTADSPPADSPMSSVVSIEETPAEMKERVLRAREEIEEAMNEAAAKIVRIPYPKVTRTNLKERMEVTEKNLKMRIAALAPYAKQLEEWEAGLTSSERSSFNVTAEEEEYTDRRVNEILDSLGIYG